MSEFLQELEQDPFDAEEFVERVAWRTTAGHCDGEAFDPSILHTAFEHTIKDLQILYENMDKKCERLEMICREEEKTHWDKITELQDKNKAAFGTFQELDEGIDFVATKVVHLGDQLESVNTPRARAVEAQKLMHHFADFLNPGPSVMGVLSDPTRLYEAADVIQKLHLIAQELPAGKFDKAHHRITLKYDEIERALIEEFVRAHRADDKVKMREVAGILSHFKGYTQCIDAFIEQSQMGAFLGSNIFADILPLCERSQKVMQEVFTSPEQVMAKFVLNIYHGKLQEHIQSKLNDRSNTDKYLRSLYDLYSRTMKLSNDLSVYKMGSDSAFLNKLTKNIFARYLDTFVNVEARSLKDKSAAILQRYYDSKNHQKKHIPSGGIHELRRDIQAKIGSRANINFGPAIENFGGETFLSEEVAINLLQETKIALQRCQTLSRQSDLPANAVQIFDILLQYLCVEHIDYALELGLQGIPLSEPKSPPEIYFFDLVRQCNAICHLLEKQFIDSVVPLVVSTPKHGICLQKKKDQMEQMELKLHNGLERSVSALVGWVRLILQSEQKKTDFRPESEDMVIAMATPACMKVVKFIGQYVEKVRDSLDGKNVESTLTELGTRFHRAIYEHLQQFQYNSVGAMVVICDVNEYRRCIKEFRVTLLNSLFDTLHALCNLLVVVPDNLKQVCTGDQLAGLERSVLMNFVQLRADYKTAKLINQFK
ncbi:exocyst complex component Sec10 isoform X1 [Tachypleus tridentatus]|uniref:exocyst complex component Sec10 isoform X1 n=2 Tax=Tachypleus tridentatus TaxID=6853 RepID=UPI003FD3A3C2